MHGIWRDGRDLYLKITGFRLTKFKNDVKLGILQVLLSIESHFVGVHGPLWIASERKANLRGAWKFAFLSDAIHMAHEHRQNAIQYLYLHLFIRPSSDGTYYDMVMSVCPGLRLSVRLSVRPIVRPGLCLPVFRTFLIHALTYWTEILHMTLFLCTTDQVRKFRYFLWGKTLTKNMIGLLISDGKSEKFDNWLSAIIGWA